MSKKTSKYPALIVALFLCLSTYAQTKTYVGMRGGLHSRSTFIQHTIFNLSHRTSYTLGTHAGILIKHFPHYRKKTAINNGIQIGASYVQKGWVQNFLDLAPDYNVTMNYLEVPIEGIVYFGNRNKYYITIGGYAEFLLSVNKDPDPDPEAIGAFDFFTYEADRDRELGYGGRLSGGLFRDFSFGSVHLEGFFTFSFSNVFDAGDLTQETPADVSNHWTLGGSIGYLIPFGKLKLSK